MTDFRSMLPHSSPEMIREAVKRCLDDVGSLSIHYVDGALCASAPDAFDGYHDKVSIANEAAGAIGKPITRVFVGGGSGVAAAVSGWYHVASGLFDTLLVVAWEKMSPPYPHAQKLFQTIFEPVIEQPLGPNLIWIFALEMRRYMEAHNFQRS
jgi:Acetyl-CoA acetyltransferase